MSRVNFKDFAGTRCRFQRYRDAKIFNGWILSFFGNKIEISTSTESPVEIDDEFRFEGFGNHISVVFNAVLEDVSLARSDTSDARLHKIEGTDVQLIEARKVSLTLKLTSPARYSASNEAVRLLADDYYILVKRHNGELDGRVIDISSGGVGVIVPQVVEPHERVSIIVETPIGPVEGEAEARYCIQSADYPGEFRVGLMFTKMGRLQSPRWNRLIEEGA